MRCGAISTNTSRSPPSATHYAQMTSTPTLSFENLVKDGILPPDYAASSDPQRLLNVIIKPEMVEILVAGDPG